MFTHIKHWLQTPKVLSKERQKTIKITRIGLPELPDIKRSEVTITPILITYRHRKGLRFYTTQTTHWLIDLLMVGFSGKQYHLEWVSKECRDYEKAMEQAFCAARGLIEIKLCYQKIIDQKNRQQLS